MQQLFLLLFLLDLLLLCVTLSEASKKSFFQRCDTDRSYSLSFEEWESCLSSSEEAKTLESENIFPTNLVELFKHVDLDKDGFISTSEYGELQKNLLANGGDGETDLLEVKMADGSIKKMSRNDLSNEMANRAKGFRKTKKDNIVKEEENKLNISSLEKDNPGLAKMIKMGNTSFEILKKMNYTEGKLTRIQTISDPLIRNEHTENIDVEDKLIAAHRASLQSHGLKFYLQLTVEQPNKDVEYFEVHIEYNSTKYFSPHIAIVAIIKKDEENKSGQILKIPPLPLKRETAKVIAFDKTVYNYGVVGFLVVSVVIAVVLFMKPAKHEKES